MTRRRGATFTIIVLLASALLLSIGGAFVDSSRNLVTLAGLRDRNERAREALAGAAEWARAAVAQGVRPGESTLELSRTTVAVELKLAEGNDAYFLTATAKAGDIVQHAKVSIARRDGRWAITRFELIDGMTSTKGGSTSTKGAETPRRAEKKKFR